MHVWRGRGHFKTKPVRRTSGRPREGGILHSELSLQRVDEQRRQERGQGEPWPARWNRAAFLFVPPLSSDCLLFVSPIPSSPPSAHGAADEGSDSQTAGWSKLELWMIAFATIAGHAIPPTRHPRSRLSLPLNVQRTARPAPLPAHRTATVCALLHGYTCAAHTNASTVLAAAS